MKKYNNKTKKGGRSSAGIIGAALSAALVPFGLMAAQKEVQKKLPVSKVNKKKTMKKKTMKKKRTVSKKTRSRRYKK